MGSEAISGDRAARARTVDGLLGGLLSQLGPEGGLVREPETKAVLQAWGLRTPEGRVCATVEEATSAAEELGYPVVVKVISPQVVHKSDVGGVRIGLGDAAAVAKAVAEVWQKVPQRQPGAELRGILVEKMVAGHELLVGATRTEFGPLLLFGLGGVMVELLRDVSYGLAPLRVDDALRMIRGIRAYPLLQGYRGQPAVDVNALAEVLVRVSQLMVEYPRILEVDLNPLLARGPDLVVADARMSLGELAEAVPEPSSRPVEDAEMRQLFAPRGVAVVGATTGRYNAGLAWLRQVKQSGYGGELYAISRKKRVEQWPTFTRVSEVTGPLDLVMVMVDRDATPDVVQECVGRGVPWVSVKTAGFAETRTKEGLQRLEALQAQVNGTSTHLIGPNALGPHCPASRLVADHMTSKRGGLALLSQSGVIFYSLGRLAVEKELGVSKGISYGSEADVTVDVLLDYLARDEATEIVAVYLEGVRRPRAFVEALERLAHDKPVVVLKGGTTATGARAAASHSGALVGGAEVWEAVFAKTGAVHAETFEELVDLLVALTHTRGLFGDQAAIVTPSGGMGVTYADSCHRHGFTVPGLSLGTQEGLAALLPSGTSSRNPVDVAQAYFRHETMAKVLALLGQDDQVSLVLFHLPMEVYAKTVHYAPWAGEALMEMLVEAKEAGKPLLVVLPHTIADDKRAEVEHFLLSRGLPVFPTAGRALTAIRKTLDFRSFPRTSLRPLEHP